jgi:hypothetical protein
MIDSSNKKNLKREDLILPAISLGSQMNLTDLLKMKNLNLFFSNSKSLKMVCEVLRQKQV